MALTNSDLMHEITKHRTNNPADALSFVHRLERDNNWSESFSRQAVIEYKRFCYLAIVCDHEVTPSDEVDQVWHLHLTNTKNYWDEFCGKVLGTPLHHTPTKGGKDERKRYADNYENTLKSYLKEFDSPAPSSIWPPAKQRFENALHYQRVNTQNLWLIPIPKFWQKIKAAKNRAGYMGGTGCGGTGCGGCGGCGGG